MMSVSPGMAAGQAARYFSREDYYLRESGQDSAWCGRGAESLSLSGPVGEEEFRALCAGTAPGGERLVAPKVTRNAAGESVGTHRAGNDCTFSAPKSVSIAYVSGVEGIKEAHDAAVESVARHLEKHNSFYRALEGLQHGKLVAARFDHATSRNIDPQLHSHLFVLNIVEAPNGSWLANEPKGIYQCRKLLGLLYRVELARELEARGFGIEIRDRSWMFFELKGVDPLLIKQFSSRREEIERQVAVWKEERRFAEVPEGRLYEMAALETRAPKLNITREEVEVKFRTSIYAAASCVSLFSAVFSPAFADPTFTSIKESDCHAPSSAITAAYEAEDLTVQECAGMNGWRLFAVSSDERSWIDIGRGSSIWSTEKEVVYKNDFGLFPNIGGAVAEWGPPSLGANRSLATSVDRLSGNYGGQAPSYLIFRIAAQAGDLYVADGKVRRVSRLFVIDLQGKEPAFCGIAKTNEDARALATRKEVCQSYLPRKTFPLR